VVYYSQPARAGEISIRGVTVIRVLVIAVVLALVLIGAWCTYSELSWLDTRVSIIESVLDLGE
jgi:hypothetical protein